MPQAAAARRHNRSGSTFTTPHLVPEPSFRLEPDRIEELRAILWGADIMRSNFKEGLAASVGLAYGLMGEDVELMGAELYIMKGREDRARLTHAYQCLCSIGGHAKVLALVIGDRQPAARSIFGAELAPLVLRTDIVRELRREMRDRLAERRIAEAQAAACTLDKARWVRDLADAAIRRGAEYEMTAELALQNALALPSDDAPKDVKLAARVARAKFIAKVAKQADTMLTEASEAYSDAWGDGPEEGSPGL